MWGWFLGSISDGDFIHAERKYTCKSLPTSAFPLQMRKPCKADDCCVYTVMAVQSLKKKKKVCPYAASQCNLNIWMMTREAVSSLLNTSFPICHSDEVQSVRPEPNTKTLVHLFYKLSSSIIFTLHLHEKITQSSRTDKLPIHGLVLFFTQNHHK